MVEYIFDKGEYQNSDIHEAKVSRTVDKSVDIYVFRTMIPSLFGGPKESINKMLPIVKLSLENQLEKIQGGISRELEG